MRKLLRVDAEYFEIAVTKQKFQFSFFFSLVCQDLDAHFGQHTLHLVR